MTMPVTTNPSTAQLQALAGSPAATSSSDRKNEGGSWYEAMASAWGQTLDNQANTIETMSNALGDGGDSPAQITKLTAESMRMGFMSNSSASSLDAVGKALETMARKG